jgi:hypothetical protein
MAMNGSLLSTLPIELIEEILMNVLDLQSIHSASQTCKCIYDVYQRPHSQVKIIKSTILRISGQQSAYQVYCLLQTLQFIINKKIVQRDIVQSIFKDMWKVFAEKEQEQLLIPFGKALAWSYNLDGRKSDAIHLLKTIWDPNGPFTLKETQDTWLDRPSALIPVKSLLDRLDPADGSHSPSPAALKKFQKEVPIAKICLEEIEWEVEWDTIRDQLDEFQQTKLMKNGILFGERFIMIKFSPLMPILESEPPTPMPLPTTMIYRFDTSDRTLIESLTTDELVLRHHRHYRHYT